MHEKLLARLDLTSSVDLPEETVRGIACEMTESELDGISGGQMIFDVGMTITVSNSCSCGEADDCCD